jgi:hypothetical protein
MESEQLQFIFSLFSFVGVIGILFYMVFEKAKFDEQSHQIEVLELKVSSLQNYVYDLDERIESSKSIEADKIKEKIIAMYQEGKESMVIENALNIPRAKIEMVIKFHQLKIKNGNSLKSVD